MAALDDDDEYCGVKDCGQSEEGGRCRGYWGYEGRRVFQCMEYLIPREKRDLMRKHLECTPHQRLFFASDDVAPVLANECARMGFDFKLSKGTLYLRGSPTNTGRVHQVAVVTRRPIVKPARPTSHNST